MTTNQFCVIAAVVLLLFTPVSFAQSLRVGAEVPVAAVEPGQMTGDDTAPRMAASTSGSFVVWRSSGFVFGTRLSADGVVLDRPAREFGRSDADPRVVSNGETFLIVTTTRETVVALIEVAGSGEMVDSRVIVTDEPEMPDVAWNGSHYLVSWISRGKASVELLNGELQTIWKLSFGDADHLAVAANRGVFLLATGSSARRIVQYSMLSSGGETGAPRLLQSGTGNIGTVAVEPHGNGFLLGFSAAVDEVVAIDAHGVLGTRVRLQDAGLTSIASTGERAYATTTEWLYTLDASLNVLFRDHNYVGELAGDGKALVASILDGYDRDIFTFRTLSSERTLVSYGLQRQLVRSAIWTGDRLTVMWEYGTIPTISRISADGVPLDGRGVSLADENALPSKSEPSYEGASAIAWNGDRFAVAFADAFLSCCRDFLRILDRDLAPVTTQPFEMRGLYGKVAASDGHHFLFADRFGTAVVRPDGSIANEDVYRGGNEYFEPPRRALWLGHEYLVLQRDGQIDRVALDGTVIASYEGSGVLDVATDGRILMGVWSEHGSFYAGRMNADGTPHDHRYQVMGANETTVPFITWDGVSFVVAAMDENTLMLRRVRPGGYVGAILIEDLPPHVVPVAFEGGRGRIAAVYARPVGQGLPWQRLRSFVRFVTSTERRVPR